MVENTIDVSAINADAGAAQTEAWLHAIARAAYLASVDLAKEKGAFPEPELEEVDEAVEGGDTAREAASPEYVSEAQAAYAE